MERLPVEDCIDEVLDALRAGRDVVLVAPPGSGKTTRVPPALMHAGLPGGGRVLVLEPRRMAARLAARWVAAERGQEVGDEVGYRVRFERREGPRTRLLFLTEGLLARVVLSDPELSGTAVVVFDEFHERSLHADLALGLVREVQGALRADLRIMVMSATLAAEPLARTLGAVVVRAEGRQHPVAIEHAARRDDARPAVQAARAVLREIDRHGGRLPGDALVFLPGAGEIHAALRDLSGPLANLGIDVFPLHGELRAEDQDRAVRKGPRPRVVLATNVAETSVTLDGVALVIDLGLHRVPRQDARTGVERLRLERVPKASAEQRAGRAGRQGPGRCVRLYTAGEYREMADALEPEVLRVDLAPALLALKAWGTRDPRRFAWVTPPPEAALVRAERLLWLLQAVDEEGGAITERGRRLADLPVHPRVGSMLLEARRRGGGKDGALLAALCEERPDRSAAAPHSGPSDLLLLRDRFHEFEAGGGRPHGATPFDARTARAVERTARQLERLVGGRDGEARDEDLLRCVLAGFPDRVARRRAPGSREVLVVGGIAAELEETSVVRDAELLVAVELVALGAGRKARIRLASAIEPEWLEELFPGSVAEELRTVWNEADGRAEGRRVRHYRGLVLREAVRCPPDPDAAAELLARAASHPRFLEALRARGLDDVLLRLECLRTCLPELGLPEVGQVELAAAVQEACIGRTRLPDVRPEEVAAALVRGLFPGDPRRFDRLAPVRVQIPSGRQATLTYRRGQVPMISAKLQEFFGSRATPRIADGRVPVAVDLLAPSGRSVQITTDLESFWRDLYPRERRELARRYPRHPWPEDPASSAPTSRPLPRK